MVDLTQFDDMYEKATAPESKAFDSVPDGKYQAVVEKMELAEAGQEAKPVIRWSLRVLNGPQKDRWIFKSAFISAGTLDYIKKDLSLLGFNGKLSELQQPETRMPFIGKVVDCQVKTKGEYNGQPNVNVYFNRVVEGAVVTPSAGGAYQPPAGDLPPF